MSFTQQAQAIGKIVINLGKIPSAARDAAGSLQVMKDALPNANEETAHELEEKIKALKFQAEDAAEHGNRDIAQKYVAEADELSKKLAKLREELGDEDDATSTTPGKRSITVTMRSVTKAAAAMLKTADDTSRSMDAFSKKMADQVAYIQSRSTGFYTGVTLLQQLNALLDEQKRIIAGRGDKGPGARSYFDVQSQIMNLIKAINSWLIGSGGAGLDLNSYSQYRDQQQGSKNALPADLNGATSTGALP
jgi:Sec-independent protein translocase protein TatA